MTTATMERTESATTDRGAEGYRRMVCDFIEGHIDETEALASLERFARSETEFRQHCRVAESRRAAAGELAQAAELQARVSSIEGETRSELSRVKQLRERLQAEMDATLERESAKLRGLGAESDKLKEQIREMKAHADLVMQADFSELERARPVLQKNDQLISAEIRAIEQKITDVEKSIVGQTEFSRRQAGPDAMRLAGEDEKINRRFIETLRSKQDELRGQRSSMSEAELERRIKTDWRCFNVGTDWLQDLRASSRRTLGPVGAG